MSKSSFLVVGLMILVHAAISSASKLSCGGDPNAMPGCNNHCDIICSNYNKPTYLPKVCLADCLGPCKCKEGYIYDDNLNKCVLPQDCSPTHTTTLNARARLDTAGVILAGEFLYQLVSNKPDENCVSSATSVLIPLAQLSLWATGLVSEQLLKVLNLKSKHEIKSVFPKLIKIFENQEHVTFEVATKYYVNYEFPLTRNFIVDSDRYFAAGGENIDFHKNEAAAKTINDWVYNKTRGKISDLIEASALNEDTRMILVNAIYFLGTWRNQFDPDNTKIKYFHKSNGQIVSIKMMDQFNRFKYYDNDQYQALQMFYDGNTFSFLVILPRKATGLPDTINTFRNPDVYYNVINNLRYESVKVTLPKMKINTNMNMGEMLKKANVTAMFDPDNDGFNGVLENNKPLFISAAIQKAYIAVDEKGTEAAAATYLFEEISEALFRNKY